MELLELPRHQSESLLRSGIGGRVAMCTPDGPSIVPVNYSVVDDAVVICTTKDSTLATHGPGTVLAFEVDQFDYENHRGWSVVARGVAHRVVQARELEHVKTVWEPHAWADGPRSVFVAIPWEQIEGRRLGEGWSIEANLLVNRRAPVGAQYT